MLAFRPAGWQIEPSYLILGVLDGIFADELELHQLEQLLCVGDTLEDGTQVDQGLLVIYAGESSEGVSLACGVALGLEECVDEVGGIWDERGRMLENGGNRKDGIFAHIGMTVLET